VYTLIHAQRVPVLAIATLTDVLAVPAAPLRRRILHTCRTWNTPTSSTKPLTGSFYTGASPGLRRAQAIEALCLLPRTSPLADLSVLFDAAVSCSSSACLCRREDVSFCCIRSGGSNMGCDSQLARSGEEQQSHDVLFPPSPRIVFAVRCR
jgi:hypothetical protein